MMQMQTLILSDFVSGTRSQRTDFAAALLDNFGRYGFVKLIDHGFSYEAVTGIFDMVIRMVVNSL